MNSSERHVSRFQPNVINDDLAFLRSRAIANPDGPEALTLAWLQARAIASPGGRVLELIALYKKRGFSIPEVDAYIDEQLVSARERLEQAQRSGALTPRVFGLVSRTVEAAVAAERRRPNCGSSNDKPVLVQALEMVAKLDEGRSDSGF